jgi:FAD-dependent urate hydroxylase
LLSSERVPRNAVVIGAGPYGLAIAANLAKANIEARCFGWPMAGWEEHMPRGMFLKSVASASAIGAFDGYSVGDYCDQMRLERFDKGGGEVPIPIDVFIAYGRWFQSRLVPSVERSNVSRVTSRGAGYEVTLDTGERLETGAVIVASGLTHYAHIPPELRQLRRDPHPEKGPLSHSSDHDDLSRVSGRIAVIGAGQSALETAVLLSEAGAEVELVVRGPALVWGRPPIGHVPTRLQSLAAPPSPLGRGWPLYIVSRFVGQFPRLPDATRLRLVASVLGPSGAWWLRERFSREIGVHAGKKAVEVQEAEGKVKLSLADALGNRETLTVDHVVCATGYRVDVSRLEFIEPAVVADLATISGSPRLSATFESSRRGLYFAGLPAAATFGPLMRFVAGTDFAARRITRGVAGRLGLVSAR